MIAALGRKSLIRRGVITLTSQLGLVQMNTLPAVSKQAANSVFSADRNRKWFQLGIGLALKACLAALMLKWRGEKRGRKKKTRFSFMAQEKARNKVVMATGFIKPPQIPQRDISEKKKTLKGV